MWEARSLDDLGSRCWAVLLQPIVNLGFPSADLCRYVGTRLALGPTRSVDWLLAEFLDDHSSDLLEPRYALVNGR